MSLNELYQEIILDHGRSPRNFGEIEGHTHEAEGFNPLCGDQVRVHVLIKNNCIEDIKFSGAGCAISTASASMMTQFVKGKTIEEAIGIFDQFRRTIVEGDESQDMGELGCLSGVKQFPNRIKCATLAWHTMKSALSGDGKVTTE